MNERFLHTLSRVWSGLFNPFWIPFLGFAGLFLFSYLSILPTPYKVRALTLVYTFTILLPMLGIWTYQKLKGQGMKDLSVREARFVPYVMSIVSYAVCLLLLSQMGLPRYLVGIIGATLMAMVACMLINFWWKVSAHMAGMGGLVGGLVSFGLLFGYNPLGWLCAAILASGLLGTARMILKEHTLGQVLCGFLIGFLCAVYGIIYT